MAMMNRAIRRLRNGEEGAALTAALFLGLAMILLSAIVMTRALGQSNAEFTDENYEHAFQVAEAGVNLAITEVNDDDTWNTGETAANLTTRADVIAAADAKPASDIIQTPDGELIIIKPTDGDLVYGVGFVPSRADINRRVRVVQTEITFSAWAPQLALYVGGDLKIDGKTWKDRQNENKKDHDIWGTSGVYIEGELELKHDYDKAPRDRKGVDGCLMANKLIGSPNHPYNNDTYSNEDSTNGPCPTQAEVKVLEASGALTPPEVDPRLLYKYAHFVICADGLRFGPNWPMNAGKVDEQVAPPGAIIPIVPIDLTTLNPCLGSPLMNYYASHAWVTAVIDGVEAGLSNPNDRIKFKDKKNDIEGPVDGVYYLVGRNMELKVEDDQHTRLTVIIEKPGNEKACWGGVTPPSGIKKEHYGDVKIEIKQRAIWEPHPDAFQYSIVTMGDLEMKMKGSNKKEDQGTVRGFLYSHEQFKLEANDVVEPDEKRGGVQGAMVVKSACDSKDSKKDKNEWKKGDFVYNGEIPWTDFGGTSTVFTATSSAEL